MLSRLLQLFGGFSRPITRPAADPLELAAEREQQLIASATLERTALWQQQPPQPEHENKRLLLQLAEGNVPAGDLHAERYREARLPEQFVPTSAGTELIVRRGFFDYETDGEHTHWFMNFAHHDLFCCYPHFQFAQDEIQVAEHPLLACLREHMRQHSDGLIARCVENGAPTPVLIRQVPRQLHIETREIYGHKFGRADRELIEACTHVQNPATPSNIVAIEAPIGQGNETYTQQEIDYALRTAYSGFRSIVLSSAAEPSAGVVLHTGNWGCGAYGGNRQLMITLQLLAARLAGLDRLIVYCGTDSKEDVKRFDAELAQRFRCRPGAAVATVVDRLAAARFPWGQTDGN